MVGVGFDGFGVGLDGFGPVALEPPRLHAVNAAIEANTNNNLRIPTPIPGSSLEEVSALSG